MKSFTEYLLEMRQQDAEKFMGLSGNYTLDDVETRYKELAMKYHPDRGGNVKQMQDLNAARKILKKSAGKGGSYEDTWQKIKAERAALKPVIQHQIEMLVHPQDFIDYFQKVFPGNTFEYTSKPVFNNSDDYAGVSYTFINRRRDKKFEVDIYSYLTDIVGSKELATSDVSYPLSIYAYGYANKRRIKVFGRDWKQTRNHKEVKPETIFPKSKITKKQTRKFSKRDMLLFMKTELKAEATNNDNFFIPLKDGKYLRAYRHVMMRIPAWVISGIYEKEGYRWIVQDQSIVTLPETEDTANLFKKFTKMDSKQVLRELDKIKKTTT